VSPAFIIKGQHFGRTILESAPWYVTFTKPEDRRNTQANSRPETYRAPVGMDSFNFDNAQFRALGNNTNGKSKIQGQFNHPARRVERQTDGTPHGEAESSFGHFWREQILLGGEPIRINRNWMREPRCGGKVRPRQGILRGLHARRNACGSYGGLNFNARKRVETGRNAGSSPVGGSMPPSSKTRTLPNPFRVSLKPGMPWADSSVARGNEQAGAIPSAQPQL
jgi:hypothetical protein